MNGKGLQAAAECYLGKSAGGPALPWGCQKEGDALRSGCLMTLQTTDTAPDRRAISQWHPASRISPSAFWHHKLCVTAALVSTSGLQIRKGYSSRCVRWQIRMSPSRVPRASCFAYVAGFPSSCSLIHLAYLLTLLQSKCPYFWHLVQPAAWNIFLQPPHFYFFFSFSR